jgi:GTP-binding protein
MFRIDSIVSRLSAPHRSLRFSFEKSLFSSISIPSKEITERESIRTNRNSFKSISPSPRVLHHLDGLKLGYVGKRRARVALTKRMEGIPEGKQNDYKMDKVQIDKEKRKKIRMKADGKVVDYVPMNLNNRPYPFNYVGRPMVRLHDASEIRSDFKTPEIAIIGRSNVGKSTLVNNILGLNSSYVQKMDVSDKPGLTQSLHMFAMGGMKYQTKHEDDPDSKNKYGIQPKKKVYTSDSAALVICDMPGYGFAYMKEEEKYRCDNLITSYLATRGSSLKRVLLLLDARHGFKSADIQFLKELYESIRTTHATPKATIEATATATTAVTKNDKKSKKDKWPVKWKMQIVLTKCDLLERSDLARTLQKIRLELSDILPSRFISDLPVMPISGLANKGTGQLLRDLSSLVTSADPNDNAVVTSNNNTGDWTGGVTRAKDFFEASADERSHQWETAMENAEKVKERLSAFDNNSNGNVNEEGVKKEKTRVSRTRPPKREKAGFSIGAGSNRKTRRAMKKKQTEASAPAPTVSV